MTRTMGNRSLRRQRWAALAAATLLTAPTASASVLFSDSFNRTGGAVCGTAVDPSNPNRSLGLSDNSYGGSPSRGYIGIKGVGSCNVVGAAIDNGSVLNSSTAFGGGGFEVSVSATCCAFSTNVGQDLNLAARVLLPKTVASGNDGQWVCDTDATIASIYFRTRNAYTGDGVRGGSASGFRVELDSLGQLRVYANNTGTFVAASMAPSDFDADVFHDVRVSVQGSPGTLRVLLDSTLTVFRRISDGSLFTSLPLPVTGGTNAGATGIEFESDPRGNRAGQRVDDYIVETAGPLLPCAGACDDGNPCTTNDTCSAGDCSGTPIDCSQLDDACANGMCDPATGTCGAQPLINGTSCDDGNANTTSDVCACGVCAGTCVDDTDCIDASACTQDECDAAGKCRNDATPRTDCLTAAKTNLLLKHNADDSKDKVSFKWLNGPALTQADFGQPTTTDAYSLCIYDDAGLVLESAVPAAAMCGTDPCWVADKTRGYKFKDRTASFGGIKKMSLRGSEDPKSQVRVDGAGVGLNDPPLPLVEPVRAQVIRDDGGICFDSSFAGVEQVKKNDSSQFKGAVKP